MILARERIEGSVPKLQLIPTTPRARATPRMRGHYGMRGPTPTPRNSTNGLRGRDSDFWVWGGSLLAARARDADALRTHMLGTKNVSNRQKRLLLTCESPGSAQTDEKSHPSCQTLQNRVPPNLRISPTCRKSRKKASPHRIFLSPGKHGVPKLLKSDRPLRLQG